jgi:hypothetical protein
MIHGWLGAWFMHLLWYMVDGMVDAWYRLVLD